MKFAISSSNPEKIDHNLISDPTKDHILLFDQKFCELKMQHRWYHQWKNWMKDKALSFFFDFTEEKIELLKKIYLQMSKKYGSVLPTSCNGYLTANDVVVAKVWYSIHKARKLCGMRTR
jgi:hypothetical protein